MSYHTVVAGDSMASIAKDNGFLWEQLWKHPKNKDLAEKRKNPNVLMAGDIVYIPEKKHKVVDVVTEERHRFRRKGIPSKLRLRLLENGRPRADIGFVLTLDDGNVIKGKTDADGYLRASVQPDRKSGMLEVTGRWGVERYTIHLGRLDPIDEVSGVRQRLSNISGKCKPSGAHDEQTSTELCAFQTENNLERTGQPDDATRARLLELCGS